MAKQWYDSLAAPDKPYELGLHKRGRNYHVSLGRDGEDGERQQYETDTLGSLRLPGKALAIVVGKRYKYAAGEMQALIHSIEITRVSE